MPTRQDPHTGVSGVRGSGIGHFVSVRSCACLLCHRCCSMEWQRSVGTEEEAAALVSRAGSRAGALPLLECVCFAGSFLCVTGGVRRDWFGVSQHGLVRAVWPPLAAATSPLLECSRWLFGSMPVHCWPGAETSSAHTGHQLAAVTSLTLLCHWQQAAVTEAGQ